MPLELIGDIPNSAVFREYEELELKPDEVRLKSIFSSVKHGTELRAFRGDSADAMEPWDGEYRLHRRQSGEANRFPMRLGNMCLGEVVEAGSEVERLKIGDRLFGHFPVRETHTVVESRVRIAPEGVSPQALMYWDPSDFAVGAVRDAPVRLGDRVAVFGLGAIGQMIVQCARLSGARWVGAIDPVEIRREAAGRHGADATLDPTQVDAGIEIKDQTGKLGVDVAFETSGNSNACYDALRSTKYEGTLISTAYYAAPMSGLKFSGEWHRNRVRIISSRACSEPLPQFGWDFGRIQSESLQLLLEGQLKADDLLHPILPFERAAEGYMEINERPERSIKLGIDHTMSC